MGSLLWVQERENMIEFECLSEHNVDVETLRKNAFSMSGVNFELSPLVRMTSPRRYSDMSILEWPKNQQVFTSVLLLFGVIPIDYHKFIFVALEQDGFEERSSTLMNKEWRHKRVIVASGGTSLVIDNVSYKPRLPFVGLLMKSIYKFIFEHRHKRLNGKY